MLLMLNTFLLVNLLGFVASPFVYPGEDWIQNPANLAFYRTAEFGFSVQENGDTIYSFGLAVPRKGLLLENIGGEWRYGYGIGFRVSSNFSIGFGQTFGFGKALTVGLTFRPDRRISLGAASQRIDGEQINFLGFGLRPFGNSKFVLLGDVYSNDKFKTKKLRYGIAVEPVDGLTFFVRGSSDWDNFEGRYKVGVAFAYSRIKAGAAENNKIFMNFSSGYYKSVVRKGHIVVVELDGKYSELPGGMRLFLGRRPPTFYELVSGLKKLEKRDDVIGVLVIVKNARFSPAQLEELHSALISLRKNGKKVFVHSNNYGVAGLWLASAADEAAISPMGGVLFPGFLGGNFYMKSLLDKIGVDVDVVHIGRYKSAGEPLSRDSMSRYEREQLTELLDTYKTLIIKDISEKMGIDSDSLIALMDSQGIWSDSEAVEIGFVDTIVYAKDVEDWVKERLGCKSTVKFKNFTKRLEAEATWPPDLPKIALVVAEGAIVMGKSRRDLLLGKSIGDETMTELIEKLRKDKSIKGVVFRVNSPGGSALASDAIWQALRELAEEKPLVVSMGGVAASGGYYISAPGDVVLADRLSVTGSIGIISLKLTVNRMLQKLGINFDYIKFGRHADAISLFTRPLTAEEESLAYHESRYYYNKFLERVAVCRNMSVERVDSLGEGRIYSGLAAQKLGLVDSLGGLLDAVEIVKKLAKIKGDVQIEVYPKPKFASILRSLMMRNASGSLEATQSLLRERVLYLSLPAALDPFRVQ